MRLSQQYYLDPLLGEVQLTQYEDQSWQATISIDGWIKLINTHPHFVGMTFSESTEQKQGVPVWMECTIHRSDRAMPITIREYLVEVQSEALSAWKKMPRRMLRHRVMQQCARVGLGVRTLESNLETQKNTSTRNQKNNSHPEHSNQTIPLKGSQKLKYHLNTA